MIAATLAALLLTQATSVAPGTEIRAVTVSFVDEKGAEVRDLGVKDVALLENGVTRDITSFKPDTRPLDVAILVDSSAMVATSFRLNLLDAVLGLVARLPEGSRYAIWTTGDRPTKIVALTGDKGAAGGALRRVAPQGGNTMLDALAEASADLAKTAREGDRTAVIAITETGPELSSRDRFRALEETLRSRACVLAVEVDDPEGDFDARARLSYVFDRLAKATGGRYEVVLSSMAADSALRKVSAVIRGSYRLAYATVPDLEKRSLKISVARPGTRVLVPAAVAQKP